MLDFYDNHESSESPERGLYRLQQHLSIAKVGDIHRDRGPQDLGSRPRDRVLQDLGSRLQDRGLQDLGSRLKKFVHSSREAMIV